MFPENSRASMHQRGLSDVEIASVEGVSRQAILLWRRKNELPANRKRGESRPLLWSIDRVEQSMKDGLSDRAIRLAGGPTRCSLRAIRRQIGIPAFRNAPRRIRKPFVPIRVDSDDLYAVIREHVGYTLSADVRDDVISELYVAVLAGDVDPSQLATVARRYMSREIAKWQSRYGHLSLNQPAGEHSEDRIALLPCPRALVEMEEAIERMMTDRPHR